jgi:hypothetical protein
MDLNFFHKRQVPDNLPAAMEDAVANLKECKNQEDCLSIAYSLLTKKYFGARIKTYTHFFDLFIDDPNTLWQKNGFLHCTNSNHLLRILLLKSGFFRDEDISTLWTLIWYISPHQYLSIKMQDGRTINIDMWSKTYGVAFGNYAHGFNSSLFAK